MERTNFEKLRVYQLSEDLADSSWVIATKWDAFNRDMLGKQVVKSADSVGANIAEGVGRYGTQDNQRFGYFARGSLNETKHWLRRAFKRNLLSPEEIEKLRPVMDELAPKLNAYIRSIKDVKRSTPTTNDERRTTNNEQPATNNENA
jgi:four helix bundle protein